MKTAEYDFFLPEDRIADRPPDKRDDARLLVLNKDGGTKHRRFRDLPLFLRGGDMLLLNRTKVFPARMAGTKRGGGTLEILLVRERLPGEWEILSKGGYSGPLRISEGVTAHISKGKTAVFPQAGATREIIWREGRMPLPPYIKRQPDHLDNERYQTVYADVEGSIAAPTAGLHFTPALLESLAERSVIIRSLVLHVGVGTFRPVKTADVEQHAMDQESFEIEPSLIDEIEAVKRSGGRIIAVGTTTTRAIEGYLSGRFATLSSNGTIRGVTDIFMYEGYRPKAVDALITNFHLPRSTPLMLTSVFARRERLLRVYQSAISMGYRFFTYGDAMLVL